VQYVRHGFCEFSNADSIWQKLLPDLEDYMLGFPNEERRKSKILDMVCVCVL
jgi:hypothetical protein